MKKRYGNELHPLYSRWTSMVARCENPNNCNYKNYGAKGVMISPELRGFIPYKDYIESLPGYDPEGAQVDRIDPTKGYEKGNLRWTDRSTQLANQTQSGKGSNKYTGVNWSKAHNRWVARVTYKGKSLFTKVCKTEREAYNVRVNYIKENSLPHYIQEWIE